MCLLRQVCNRFIKMIAFSPSGSKNHIFGNSIYDKNFTRVLLNEVKGLDFLFDVDWIFFSCVLSKHLINDRAKCHARCVLWRTPK